jgi:hypothetical protein
LTYDYTFFKTLGGDDATAITNSGNNFSVFYDKKIFPIAQTQTVTVTATSTSIYNDTPTTVVVPEDFEVTFLRACANTEVVVLTDPGQDTLNTFNYDGSSQTFAYKAFGVEPAWCDIEIACNNVSPVNEFLKCDGHELNEDGGFETSWAPDGDDYTQGLLPGTYTYTYDVKVGDEVE